MKIRKLVSISGILSAGIMVFAIMSAPKAWAAVKTWDGDGADNKFSTAENWNGDTVPQDGDSLVFPGSVPEGAVAVENDMDNLSVSGVSFTGADRSYSIEGNALTVAGTIENTSSQFQALNLDITLSANTALNATGATLQIGTEYVLNVANYTLTISASSAVYLNSDIQGSGDITKSGSDMLILSGDNSAYTGAITAEAGALFVASPAALGGAAGSTVINNGADISLCALGLGDETVYTENFLLSGESSDVSEGSLRPKLLVQFCGKGGAGGSVDESYGHGGSDSSGRISLTGSITLGSDITFGGLVEETHIKGVLSGDFDIKLLAGYSGKLIVNSASNNAKISNGTYTPKAIVKTLSDDAAGSSVEIRGGAIITLTGKRGSVTLLGGILKGTGTAGSIYLHRGTLAPGLSPGILNSDNLIFSGGVYEVELGGTANGEHDQTNVTGTVELGSSTTLTVLHWNDYKPVAGDEFTIINNDGGDAVKGAFKDLPEGATFTVDGYVYTITYTGGDGNDVVVTVKSVPGSPNTGFMLLSSNPLAMLALSTIASIGILFAGLKYQSFLVRNHR